MKMIQCGHVHYGRVMPDKIVTYSSTREFVKECAESNYEFAVLYKVAYNGKYESNYKTSFFSGFKTHTVSADSFYVKFLDSNNVEIHPVTLYMAVHKERKNLNPVWLANYWKRRYHGWRKNFSSACMRYPTTTNEIRLRESFQEDQNDLEEIGYKGTMLKHRGRYLPTAYDDLNYHFSNGWKTHRKTKYRINKPRKAA
jgi:hypothetical protein